MGDQCFDPDADPPIPNGDNVILKKDMNDDFITQPSHLIIFDDQDQVK